MICSKFQKKVILIEGLLPRLVFQGGIIELASA